MISYWPTYSDAFSYKWSVSIFFWSQALDVLQNLRKQKFAGSNNLSKTTSLISPIDFRARAIQDCKGFSLFRSIIDPDSSSSSPISFKTTAKHDFLIYIPTHRARALSMISLEPSSALTKRPRL